MVDDASGVTTEGGEVAAPARVEGDLGLCTAHLQAVYGQGLPMEEPLQGLPMEERLAQREAEATAGQQEARDESWVSGFGGADWVTTDVEGTKQQRVEKKEKLRVEKAQKAAEIAGNSKC